jgi:hypothetical protein
MLPEGSGIAVLLPEMAGKRYANENGGHHGCRRSGYPG